MKLYTLPASPNGRKVIAVMHHLGQDIDIEYLDFARGEISSRDFLAINPNGMVPVLVEGSMRLWESNAITQYLADKSGDSSLYPRDLGVRVDINRWQLWEQAHFNRAFGTLVFEGLIKPRFGMGEAPEDLIAFCLRELSRFAPVLDAHLAGREVLVGNDITIADYSMICLEKYRDATPFDWSGYHNINRYFDRMRSTEAWVAAAPPAPAPQPQLQVA